MNVSRVLLLILLNLLLEPVLSMSWLIDLKQGGIKAATRIAKKHNLILKKSRVGHIKGLYLLESKEDYKHRRRRSAQHLGPYKSEIEMQKDIANALFHEKYVSFVEPQKALSRKKRGFIPADCCDNFNDPEYPNQWFYQNKNRLDMNIHGAWKQGITGKGVVVTILDDGVEHRHDDLRDNWDPAASYDFNDNDMDPSPRINSETSDNKHGTRCAGQVAASANNSKCGVGAAFQANIGGVRMLDGKISDSVECDSISFKKQYIDIYSMSWGPDDDGETVDGPGHCTKLALKDGAKKGRNGKGSIFVWASGNGGKANDDCNLDGYVSSIYTIAISAISSNGLSPWYSESCACTLASAYSSGFSSEKKIITTDVGNSCTNGHTGTSAAAPLAVGIIALVIQANPELTWRDVQHLIVQTASRGSNDRQERWTMNGAGHEFHHKLGFGVLDATKMVNMAKNWTTVPPQRKCVAIKVNHTRTVPPQKILTMVTNVLPEHCDDKASGRSGLQHLNKLEHVQLFITITTAVRGDIMLKLTSPSGTTSKLLSMRPSDNGENKSRPTRRDGFKNWSFTSTNFWDENPYGKWHFQTINGNQHIMLTETKLRRFKLVFYGSGESGNEEEDVEEEEEDEEEISEETEDLVAEEDEEEVIADEDAEEDVEEELVMEEDLIGDDKEESVTEDIDDVLDVAIDEEENGDVDKQETERFNIEVEPGKSESGISLDRGRNGSWKG